MMQIPDHLYPVLVNTLVMCGPFQTDQGVQAVFVRQSLWSWRNHLPSATTPQERVELIVAFLAEKYNVRGENGLLLLLQALQKRVDEGDVCHKRLGTLISQFVESAVRPATKPEIHVEQEITPRAGLIIAVSAGRQPTPADSALAYHLEQGKMTHCWLLVGPGIGEQSSPANALRIQELLQVRGIVPIPWHLPNADDIEHVFAVMQAIAKEARVKYNLERERLIADYTGGTKTLTAGIILGAMSAGIDLQYMKPRAYLPSGQANREAGSSPHQVDITFVAVKESSEI